MVLVLSNIHVTESLGSELCSLIDRAIAQDSELDRRFVCEFGLYVWYGEYVSDDNFRMANPIFIKSK